MNIENINDIYLNTCMLNHFIDLQVDIKQLFDHWRRCLFKNLKTHVFNRYSAWYYLKKLPETSLHDWNLCYGIPVALPMKSLMILILTTVVPSCKRPFATEITLLQRPLFNAEGAVSYKEGRTSVFLQRTAI